MRLARKPFNVSTMIANECRCFSIEPIKVKIGKAFRIHHQLLLLKGDSVAVSAKDHASLDDPCVYNLDGMLASLSQRLGWTFSFGWDWHSFAF